MIKDLLPKAKYGTLKYFQQVVAIEHGIGENLVMGHKKTYFDKAAYLHTKFHVTAALEAASKKATTYNEYYGNTGSEYCDTVVDRDSILNAYPETNII